MKNFFFTIFHPSFWVMNHPYSKAWDEQFNILICENKFEKIDNYHARLGNLILWTVNYPHAAFSITSPIELKIRPKRYTIYLAYQKMIKDLLAQ